MKRFAWGILAALLIGLGLGLVYAWVFTPLRVTNSAPNSLRADFKDQYRALVAAAFESTGNLPRAEARLSLLGEPDLVGSLNSQAQRMTASGDFSQADQLVALAEVLQNRTGTASDSPAPVPSPISLSPEPTNTPPPTPEDLQFILTETPQAAETKTPEATLVSVNTPAPRPTRTAIPTIGAPFILIEQETVCNQDLPDGLLQVFVFNASRRQVAGARIIITWDNGEDQFFTGLKPEISNGYADFTMQPNVAYTVRLAAGSDILTDLTTPTCQAPNGEAFPGGLKLTFQQP
jgi:hypothetical protein